MVGVAGRSGSGKSTLVRLLLRLVHPVSGTASLGGVPLENVSRAQLARLIGYVGQEGIFEVFRLDKPERELIKAGNLSGLRAEFRKKGLPTIQQAALKKAFEGTTSVEELSRVTAEQKPPDGGAGPKQGGPPAGPKGPAGGPKPQPPVPKPPAPKA